MDWYLAFLAGLFAALMAALHKFMMWWQRKDHEKIMRRRYAKEEELQNKDTEPDM